MALYNTQGRTVGNNDPAVSPYLKTWVSQGGVVVCGVTGEGTSKEIAANWDSPFEGESVEGKFGRIGGLAQATGGGIDSLQGITTITTMASQQVWSGNRPTQFNVVMKFYALRDPQSEVMAALKALEEFASPSVDQWKPGGRIPSPVVLNIGRNAIYPDCVIESVSMPMDKEVDKNGHQVRAEVTLQVQTMRMLNRAEIAARYG